MDSVCAFMQWQARPINQIFEGHRTTATFNHATHPPNLVYLVIIVLRAADRQIKEFQG
jgi:hypothetical protein